MKKYLFLLLTGLSCYLSVSAQDDTIHSIIRTDTIRRIFFLPKNILILLDTTGKLNVANLKEHQFLQFQKVPRSKIPKRIMTDGYVYLMLFLKNNESVHRNFYFTAGSLASSTELFEKDTVTGTWLPLPVIKIPENTEQAYRGFQIDAGKQIQILAKVQFAKTNVAILNPYLINSSFIDYHLSYLHNHWFNLDTLTYLLCGALLMMLLFSMASFFQNGKREFLFYSLYAISLSLLLYLKANTYKRSTPFTFFNEEYLDYALLIIGYIFYISFTRKFLNTPKVYPLLNRLFFGAEVILALFLLLFTYDYFTQKSYQTLNQLENISKFFMIFIGLTYVVLGIIRKNRLFNYLLAGNLANLLMAGFSQYMIIVPSTSLVPESGIFRQALFYFETGIVLEMIFFLVGLTYKNRVELIEKVKMDEALKQESERQQYEKQIAVLSAQQEERTRISADMHDELGSGVTAIRLLSEIARNKMQAQPLEELSKISFNANDLMIKMNGIIWSMNPGHDTIDSLLSYIRSYASDYCETFHIACNIHMPDELPGQMISGYKRRNIFLVIKEALNNIVKHSGATEVTITITLEDRLTIEINDNGKGLDDTQKSKFGNGLKNMKRRMESIHGNFTIDSPAGTTVFLTVPVAD